MYRSYRYRDHDYDPADYYDEECGGASDECEGCDGCTETSTTTRTVIARAPRSEAGRERRAKSGIRPGDKIRVTTGFEYQTGGGPRIGYVRRCEQLVEPGPAWSADEREKWELEKQTMSGYMLTPSWNLAKNVRIRDFLKRAREFEERTGMTLRWKTLPGNIRGPEELEAQLLKMEEAQRIREEDEAEWKVLLAAPEESEVTFRGCTYVKSKSWSHIVYHSALEDQWGNAVDASVVGRFRLVPTDGDESDAIVITRRQMPPRPRR